MIIFLGIIAIILFILCLSSITSSIIIFNTWLSTKDKEINNTYLPALLFTLLLLISITLLIIILGIQTNKQIIHVIMELVFNTMSKRETLTIMLKPFLLIASLTFILQSISMLIIKLKPKENINYTNALPSKEKETSLALKRKTKLSIFKSTLIVFLTNSIIFFIICIFMYIGIILSRNII